MSCEATYRNLILEEKHLAMLDVNEDGRTLEDFKILKIRIFGIYIKLDSLHGNIQVDAIEDLA
jgi:hypothetical protein